MTDDVAYLQNLSRHRTVLPVYDIKPVIDESFIAPSASLIGDVHINTYASVGYNCTLKAEFNTIRLGAYSSLGDGTSIITSNAVPTNVLSSTTIGKSVTIENNCTLYSCIIDDGVYIGANTIILEGSKVEKGAAISPNSFVPPGRLIPAGQLWGGNPVNYIRELSEQERLANVELSLRKWQQALVHKEALNCDSKLNPESEEKLTSYLTDNYFDWRAKYH